MMLAVGCPVSHREWALDAWFDHVIEACDAAFAEPTFIFVGDPEHDRSFEVIARRAPSALIEVVPNTRGLDRRDWGTPGRYQEMVKVRNRLLARVRVLAPPAFLSLDSDIMIHPDGINRLLDDLGDDDWDAIGGKCFMGQVGTREPSWAMIGRQGGLQRYDTDGYFPVDVLMAIKMMGSRAYRVDYELHAQGEDTGWSVACRKAGLKLAWDGRVASKHVMAPHLLGLLDPRVGY